MLWIPINEDWGEPPPEFQRELVHATRAADATRLVIDASGWKQLEDTDLVDVHEETVENRMTTVEQKMFLAELLDNMHDAIASAGAATPDQVTSVRAAVAAGAARSDTVFVQARMHQVSARRPSRQE